MCSSRGPYRSPQNLDYQLQFRLFLSPTAGQCPILAGYATSMHDVHVRGPKGQAEIKHEIRILSKTLSTKVGCCGRKT